MQGALLLDVVVREGATVFELLSSEDETLLIGRNSFLILNFGLHVIDGVRRFYLERDGLAGEGLDKDLHTTTETKDEVQGALLLNVVIRKRSSVFELLAGEDKSLLVRWDALLVLNLGLYIVNRVRRFHLERDGLAGEGLDKDLHTTTKTENQMESRLLLDVVVREGAPVLELLTSKDQTLLVRGNSFLILNFGLDVINRVGGLHLKGDSLTRQSLDKDLHGL